MRLLALLVGLALALPSAAQNYAPINANSASCSVAALTLTPSGGSGWACVAVGGAAWGSITGTLATQTDLATELAGKAPLVSPVLVTPNLGTPSAVVLTNATGFPTLNQNTTGSAATLTTPRTINGTSFNGSANITLGTGSVTLAQMADMATASVVYRKTAGTGVPEVQTLATLKTDLALVKADVGLGNADNTTDAGKPVSTAQQTALDLKANLASPTFTGTVTLPASTSLTTPVIGAATGTSLAATGAVTSSGTAGVGYATGAGGTVTQATSKTTGVTLNKRCGAITMHNAALAAAAEVAFTVTNSTVAAVDVPVVAIQSVGTAGAYFVSVGAVAAGSFSITVGNASAGSLSQAVVLNFCVIKGANS